MMRSDRVRGLATEYVSFDDIGWFPEKEPRKSMTGNTMMVPYQRYLDLKRTGRVRGGDPLATASEPIVYTDENGIEWSLAVTMPSTEGPNMNLGPMLPAIKNRKARRTAAAKARRAK